MNTIAERLNEAMLNHGYEQSKVKTNMAKICGLSRQAVHQWFGGSKGATVPTAEPVAKIAVHCNADFAWLVLGDEPPLRSEPLDPQETETAVSDSSDEASENNMEAIKDAVKLGNERLTG